MIDMLSDMSHRRYNPLLGEWVLVSPHRGKRPWQGQEETPDTQQKPSYDPSCYLCPGNKRIGGHENPSYEGPHVFANDFPALQDNSDTVQNNAADALFRYQAVSGEARVICFSPDHSKSLPLLTHKELQSVVDVWREQEVALSQKYAWVQIFENKGSVMGCSNPHPHGQIWAQDQLPTEAAKIDKNFADYYQKNNSNLLLDYAEIELEHKTRLVDVNEHWLSLVPFWACWPYEILVLPRKPVNSFQNMSSAQQASLAELLKCSLTRYDNLFKCSFPYSMGWRVMPFDREAKDYWQMHAVFFPPLLRSATVKKFMVGYEMLAEAQRDITPEQAAQRLRECSDKHYSLSV